MINWKLRVQNKATLTALVFSLVSLVYQILGVFHVVPGISESQAVEIIGIIINILTALGIVIDPTTSGITDSARAMKYEKPNNDK